MQLIIDIDSISILNSERGCTELKIEFKDRTETYEGYVSYNNATPAMKDRLCSEARSKHRIYYAVDEVWQNAKTIELRLNLSNEATIRFNGCKLIKTEVHT